MNSVYEEILSRKIEEDFAKADLNDEPRAEMRSRMPKGSLDKGASVVDHSKKQDSDEPIECALDMGDDAHHGGDELVGEHNDPINKAGGGKSTSAFSESSASGLGGADSLSAGSYEVPGGEIGAAPGMPSTDDGQDEMLSDDDVSVESMMQGKSRPIDSTVPHGSGDLGQNKVMLQKSDYGEHGRAAAVSRRNASGDVRLNTRGAPVKVAVSAPAGKQWKQGFVSYSTSEDERIAKSMEAGNGHVLGEPIMGFKAEMARVRSCGLCKSVVPNFLTVCPCCGR